MRAEAIRGLNPEEPHKVAIGPFGVTLLTSVKMAAGQRKGGLAFLGKKAWHPASKQMREKIAAAELQHQQEQAKIAQLQKEAAEQRQREEMRQLEIRAGLRSESERMEWMLPSNAMQVEQEREEYLLGKQKKYIEADQKANKVGSTRHFCGSLT